MRIMTLLPVSAGFVILLAGATPSGPGTPDPGLEAPFLFECNGCSSCYASSYWHRTNFEPPDADYSPPQHACQLDGSCGTHGICGGGEEDIDEVALVHELEAIRTALLSKDPEAVRGVLEAASSRVVINETRMAIQVAGCSDGVVAHFPLPQDFLAALLD